MLYRDKNSAEGYIHICNDSYKYNKKALQERIPIQVHDIRAYIILESGKQHKLETIKFCPYCGADLDKEERTNEFYKF